MTRAVFRSQTKIVIFFILFAGLIVAAEQNSPCNPVKVEDWTADYLASVKKGNIQREVAYLLLAAVTGDPLDDGEAYTKTANTRKGAVTLGLFVAWAGASAS